MKKIIGKSIRSYFKLRSLSYQTWKKNALADQDLLLEKILQSSLCTEYGKKYESDTILTYSEFSEHFPFVEYNDIKADIQRMIDGEMDVLWPGKVSFFSKSSGTTSDISKYLPISHDALYVNNYSAGRDLYTIIFDLYPDLDIFQNKGKVLGLGGSMDELNSGAFVGDVSAFIMSQLPRWAESYREPKMDIALLSEWKDKLPAIIEDTLGKNITHITGVPTWFISLFNAYLKETNKSSIKEIFPHLELFIHGAVAFGPYRKIFDGFLGKDAKYIEVYNASEGFFAIQDTKDSENGMLLLTNHAVFYEFIPMEVFGTEKQYAISLADVELGKNYALVITTSAGLYRYIIGDTVMFTSLDPYRIKITGRTKHFINAFGEELMVGDTDKAFENLSKKTGLCIKNYTAAPIFMDQSGKGAHEWLIEWDGKEPDSIDEFAEMLDFELQGINSDYRAKRQNDIALQRLVLNKAYSGQFELWLESKGKLGGQYKVPRLGNNRKILEEILATKKPH